MAKENNNPHASEKEPGAGELFKLRPDGKLSYTTSYEPATEGF